MAIAAAKCYLARWKVISFPRVSQISRDSFHPEECAFCDFPLPRLAELAVEFAEWAGFTRTPAYDEVVAVRGEVEMFETLPREEQRRLVAKAQGYGRKEDDAQDHAAGA